MQKDKIIKLINWWKNTDMQGVEIYHCLFPELMDAFGDNITEILSFLDSMPVEDLAIISGCFELLYKKFMTEDVYSALCVLEEKINL